MSVIKSVSIQEHGVAKDVEDISKIVLERSDINASGWVPEELYPLVRDMRITQNGEYEPTEGAAYSDVVVMVPGGGDITIDGQTVTVPPSMVPGSSIRGIWQDGKEYVVTVGIDGVLVWTEVSE